MDKKCRVVTVEDESMSRECDSVLSRPVLEPDLRLPAMIGDEVAG